MSVPAGAVLRNPATINQFYPNLDALFSTIFHDRNIKAQKSWVKQLFSRVALKGAYYVGQTYTTPATPRPYYRGEEVQDSGVNEYTLTLQSNEYATPRYVTYWRDERDSFAPIKARETMEKASDYLNNYDEMVLPELMDGSTGTYLHGEVDFTNILGGTGLFSDSHSYEGQTLDNQVEKTITNLASAIDALYSARQVFHDMLLPNGEPYWDTMATENAKFIVVVPTELEEIFNQLTGSSMIALNGVATTSNYFKDVFGQNYEYHTFNRLTSATTVRVFRVGSDDSGVKPFLYGEQAEQNGASVYTQVWNDGNSDESRRTRIDGIRFFRDMLFGIGSPFCATEIVAA